MNMQKIWRLVFFVALLLLLLIPTILVDAEEAVVRAVLFYSPSCGACQKVITEDLPPLIDEYGNQLSIIAINVTVPEGQALYQDAIETFNIEHIGVPCLIIGDQVLIGALEIPQQFPDIIDTGLVAGGIDWPDIPGFKELVIDEIEASEQNPRPESHPAEELTLSQRFSLDLAGNSLSVIVLLGMVVSVIGVGYSFVKGDSSRPKPWPNWSIPVLVIIGIAVAVYLSFVEVTHSEAICGPVGDCNTVQQSSYALLFGVLPVGVLGVAGYLLIMIAWIIELSGPAAWRRYAAIVIWGLALFGVLFSIYLTFLEPFVIGATCAWCIISAIIMTLILWASTGTAKQSWRS